MKVIATMLTGLLLASCLPSTPLQKSLNAVASESPVAKGDLVVYPNSNVEFIIGPQLKSGSKLNPWPWFDEVATTKGVAFGEKVPVIPPITLTGKVSATRGSKIVSGAGTRFLSEINMAGPAPYFGNYLRIRDADGIRQWNLRVASIPSDRELTLTEPYDHADVTGADADTYYNHDNSWNFDQLYGLNYYDGALCQYINYYRTGDERFLAYARRTADAWWKSDGYRSGAGALTGGSSNNPRASGFLGLALRAMDGHPEMWEYLNFFARWQFDSWVGSQVKARAFTIDLREAAYAQLFVTVLAKVLPDSFPVRAGGKVTNGAALRAKYLADAEDAAVNYWGRFQQADGSYRWDNVYHKIDGVGGGGTCVGNEWPFQTGILLEALVALHRLTTNPNVKANVQNQITKSVTSLYLHAFRKDEVVRDLQAGNIRWRAFFYVLYGGTTVVPHLFDPPNAGTQSGNRLSNGSPDAVSNERELNSTLHQPFGYAYFITGDPKYRQWGDDVFDASFGGSDGIRSQAAYGPKQYNMNYRASGRYLVWRLGKNFQSAQPEAPRSVSQIAVRVSEMPKAPSLIASALATAAAFSKAASIDEMQAKYLVAKIEEAKETFATESKQFTSPNNVLEELNAALAHARTALAAAAKSGSEFQETARSRAEWAQARLKRAQDRAKLN